MWYIQSLATLVMWFKLLYYLRMFRAAGYLVRSFINTVQNIFSFLTMYVIAVLTFSQTWFIISNYHETYITDTGYMIYQDYLHSWTAVWQVMYANLGDVDSNASFLAWMTHILGSLVIFLSMLNMLIASVCAS